MLTAILFIIIGVWLKAPAWYFVMCGVMLFLKMLSYGIRMYKAGMDK